MIVLIYAAVCPTRRKGRVRKTAYLISGCVKTRVAKRALQDAEEIPQRKVLPDMMSYSAVIGARRKDERALELYDEKRQQGLKPTLSIYTALITACGKGGMGERALLLFDELRQQQGLKPHLYTYTAYCIGRQMQSED